MKQIITLLAVGFSFGINAQTADQYVIGSLGGSFTNASIDVNYTAGEAVIETLSSATIIVTQGFQQPLEAGVGLEEIELFSNLSLYPNPTNDVLNIRLEGMQENYSGEAELEIYSVNGERVFSDQLQSIDLNFGIQLHVANLMPGHYQVRLITPDGRVGRAKFVKS